MESVTGIGGFFIRAQDPERLGKWYEEMLGITINGSVWHQQAGPTVFAPFPKDTAYFDRPTQQWMINFRVADLNAMIAQLRAKGVTVVTKDAWNSSIGTFARIHDPEGNPVELWQPGEDWAE